MRGGWGVGGVGGFPFGVCWNWPVTEVIKTWNLTLDFTVVSLSLISNKRLIPK